MEIISSREEFEHRVVTMKNDGWKIRAIARHFGVGRNTIKRILRRHKAQRNEEHTILPQARIPRHSKLDKYVPKMKELLETYPKITGLRMFEELQEEGYDGGITIVRERLNKLRPHPKKEPTDRFETVPGEQGQMDWSPYTIPFTEGGKTRVLCFSYILGFSRRQYIDFTTDRKLMTLIRRHKDAFIYFGGVPKHCLYDNEKTIVLRWEAGKPVYNPSFIAFITHYRCKPKACHPRRPQTKGKVEAPFQYVEQNFLNARTFRNLDDLRQKARWWLSEKSDKHIHDTTKKMPLQLFLEEEKAALHSLPLHHYDTSEVLYRICRLDGFVEFETNIYSVPFDYVTDLLIVKASEHEITIYDCELNVVACHERIVIGKNEKIELPEHRSSKKKRYGLEPVKEAFIQLGDSAEIFLDGLKRTKPRLCGFHARSILMLRERYHPDHINSALKHAHRYYAYDCRSIERILQTTAPTRTLESKRNEKARQKLQENLPPIKQRSLEEYSILISSQEEDDDTTS